MNNNIKISAHDMKNILNSTDGQLNKAISYVKEHGVEIDDNTSIKALYEKLNEKIIKLADAGKDEEELADLNDIFYGLVGLMMSNKADDMDLPKAWKHNLKVYFNYHSNAIEGSNFSIVELNQLASKNIISGTHHLYDVYETVNSLRVFDVLMDELGKELDKFMLFEWHRILKKNSIDEELGITGCWKKFENRLRKTDIKLASPAMVDNLIFNLLADWNEIKYPTIEDIARFHYRFEMIHPFQDGNGRIGRFTILKQCLDNNIRPIVIKKDYSKEYKEALYKAQKHEDINDLVEVFKKCII